MSTAENIEKLIKEFFRTKKSSAAVSPQMDEKVLDDALAAYEKSRINTSAQLQPSIWRIIMKSKTTKYSAAAVIVLAMALVILSPFGSPRHYNVLLANTQERITETDTMVYRGQKIFTCADDPNISFKFDTVKYMSKVYGHTEEGYIGDQLAYRITFNLPRKQSIVVLPFSQKCLRFPCTRMQLKILEKLNPAGIIDLLLQNGYKELGAGNIDGIEAKGFELQDVKSIAGILPKFLLDLQQGKGVVWVGTKELLPIKMEGDMIIGRCFGTGFTELRVQEFCVLENYNIELDENIFNADIPEGYTEIKITDFIPIKAGLAGAGFSIFPVGT